MHSGLMMPQTPSNSAEFNTRSPLKQVSNHHQEDESQGESPIEKLAGAYAVLDHLLFLIESHSVPQPSFLMITHFYHLLP